MSTIHQPTQLRTARIRAIQAQQLALEAELLTLIEDDQLVARASVEAEVAASAPAAAPTPARPRKPRRRRRAKPAEHPTTTAEDLEMARRAARRAGMLPR